MTAPRESAALRAGWNESSAVIRNGCSGVELVAPSPPIELVMSAATIRPPWSQGSVKSSSAISATLSLRDPGGAHAPVGRARRVVDEVRLRLGDAVVAARHSPARHQHRVPRVRRRDAVVRRVAPAARGGVAEQPAAPADPREPVAVDVDVVRVVGQPVVALQVDRVLNTCGCAGSRRSVTQIGSAVPARPGVKARDTRSSRRAGPPVQT